MRVSTSGPSQTLQNLSYAYDAVGNITQITDHADTGTGKVVNFNHDALNRLTFASTTAASSTPFRASWAYDVLGNTTGYATSTATCTYSYAGKSYAYPDAVTQIANGMSTSTFSYDQSGNENATGATGFSWDCRNRLNPVTTGPTYTDSYDENDHRVRIDDGTTIFHYQ